MYSGLDVFALMAIPLFLFAGYLMSEVKISARLVALASIFLGRYRGGLSLVATGSSAIFGAISGSANATTAAIGSVMIPEMSKRGYDQADSAAVVASSGILGLVVPPSITMVLYGVVASVSIGDLFLSGILPAIIISAGLMGVNYYTAYRKGYQGGAPVPRKDAIAIARDSLVALAMPLIILGGIYSGAFTPTESAAVACAYGLLAGFFWYRNLTLKSVFQVSKEDRRGHSGDSLPDRSLQCLYLYPHRRERAHAIGCLSHWGLREPGDHSADDFGYVAGARYLLGQRGGGDSDYSDTDAGSSGVGYRSDILRCFYRYCHRCGSDNTARRSQLVHRHQFDR
nr:TRAP transporter large permease [Salinicola tamaricis]